MNVLLCRLSALGDIVHTWPLAEALVGAAPAVRLAWVVEERFAGLVAGHPAVAEVVPVATRRWRHRPFDPATRREVAAVRVRLRALGAEVCLDPQGLVKSALWGWLAGSPRRIGLARTVRRETAAGLFYTERVSPPPAARHVVDINLSLLEALSLPAPYGSIPDAGFLLTGAGGGPVPAAGTVALIPTSGGPGKALPVETFADVARRCAAAGRPVSVVWGPGEERLAAEVAAAAGAGAVVAPPTTIPELARFLGRCAAVVGGDTGPVHLAAATGVPTVAVHVATDAARNGPRGRRVAVLSAARGGARRGRARTGGAGRVSADEVFEALSGLLGAPPPERATILL